MSKASAHFILFVRPAFLAIIVLWWMSAPGLLKAADVELPLFLQIQILQHTVEKSLNMQPDGKAVLYQNDPYNYLHITQPELYIADNEVHFRCMAAAGAGFKPIGILPTGVGWSGSIDLNLFLYVDREWQLRFRIIDSTIYEEDGSKALVSGFIWHLAKGYLHPVLEDFSFDLSVPQQEIIALLRTGASPEDTRILEETLATVQPGSLRINDNGVVVPLLFTLADRPPREVAPIEPQKPLSEKELEAFQQVFEPLDAFLVFVVKTVGADFVNARQREMLFELLITSRYQLLAILSGEVAVDAHDPLRLLFENAWQQLKSVIEYREGQNSLMQDQLLRYMTFINAGDALLVLDTAAPQLGMHITTDGLRRLARMLNPDYVEDPLLFDWRVDPVLRDLFNFIPVVPDEETSTIGGLLLDLFVGTAYAGEAVPVTAPEFRRLDRWVPAANEMDDFTSLVARLLQFMAMEQLKSSRLDNPSAKIYRHLVPATALMESCWRQYALEGGKVVFVRSRSGSVGMMQINQHVWRGFYNIDKLKWDVVYNVQAGTEILMHYFKDYGLKVAEASGKPEDAARAAYSAYNAGPRAAKRFMKKNATAREKEVDTRLWNYFASLSAGGSVNPATCNVDRKTS
ncbi:MAG: transglycosylase SLT domain-containing protein [Desulfobulbaceae bacterium]|nr:transglycosylase SLT domain-containing protein [Desulfobulbaceae bacterium]